MTSDFRSCCFYINIYIYILWDEYVCCARRGFCMGCASLITPLPCMSLSCLNYSKKKKKKKERKIFMRWLEFYHIHSCVIVLINEYRMLSIWNTILIVSIHQIKHILFIGRAFHMGAAPSTWLYFLLVFKISCLFFLLNS